MRKTKEQKSEHKIPKINNGITLIALVITIIVMLILVSVTISMAINGGLFEYAGKAVGEMQNAIEVEQQLANGRINIGGTWYDSIDDYIKGKPSSNQSGEERKIKVEYTQNEGEDLWNSIVTLTISLEEETELTLEQKRNIAAYMFDYSDFEEFKTGLASLYSAANSTTVTYEQMIAQKGEETLLNEIIALGKQILSFKDIDKLENLGVKVISVKTPYGTTKYTTSLGGEVECGFIENGTYTFEIESGGSKVTQNVVIDNIRNYDDQTPHDVKIDYYVDDNSTAVYSIDDSEETTILSSTILSVNDSISFKANSSGSVDEGNYLRYGEYISYVIKDEKYYKYFSDDETWDRWCFNNDAWILPLVSKNYSLTCRQSILFLVASDQSPISLSEISGEWVDYMEEFWIPKEDGETIDEEEMLEKYPQAGIGEYYYWGSPGNENIKTLNFTKDTNICVATYYCLTTDTYVEVVIWDDEKKRKIRIRKKLKDVTYEDELLVWDFDKGEFTTAKPLWIMKTKVASKYNLLKFSDGSELKTIHQHRIFNKEAGKFTYPMTDETPLGTTTYTAEGKEVKLVSKEVIVKEVEYTNIITKYHINVFANNILTSCRFSNIYPIEDMKYVKDDRRIVGKEKYANIPEEYYYGLRLGEQPTEINRENDVEHANSIEEHIQRVYLDNAKEI